MIVRLLVILSLVLVLGTLRDGEAAGTAIDEVAEIVEVPDLEILQRVVIVALADDAIAAPRAACDLTVPSSPSLPSVFRPPRP